jgi:hypothetical protein
MHAFKREDLSRVFPFVDFHENMAIAADGTISVCFKASLAFQDQYSDQNYRDWVAILSSSIKALPCHTLVQQVDIFWPDQWETKEKAANFFQEKQIEHHQGRPILRHESYFILSFPGLFRSYSPLSTFFSRGETKNFSKNPFARLESRLAGAKQTAAQFQQSVSSVLPLLLLSADTYAHLTHRCMALNFSDPAGRFNGGFWQEKSHIYLAGKQAQVVSLLESTAAPSYTVLNNFGHHGGVHAPLTDAIGRNLNFPHIISRVIRVIDSEVFLKKHFNEFAWSQATKVDERNIQNIQHVRDEMAALEQTLKQRSEPIVLLSLLVIPFGTTDLKYTTTI